MDDLQRLEALNLALRRLRAARIRFLTEVLQIYPEGEFFLNVMEEVFELPDTNEFLRSMGFERREEDGLDQSTLQIFLANCEGWKKRGLLTLACDYLRWNPGNFESMIRLQVVMKKSAEALKKPESIYDEIVECYGVRVKAHYLISTFEDLPGYDKLSEKSRVALQRFGGLGHLLGFNLGAGDNNLIWRLNGLQGSPGRQGFTQKVCREIVWWLRSDLGCRSNNPILSQR